MRVNRDKDEQGRKKEILEKSIDIGKHMQTLTFKLKYIFLRGFFSMNKIDEQKMWDIERTKGGNERQNERTKERTRPKWKCMSVYLCA